MRRRTPAERQAEAAIIREEVQHFRRTWGLRAGTKAEVALVGHILRQPAGEWAPGWRNVARLLQARRKGRAKG